MNPMATTPDTASTPTPTPAPPVAEPYPNIFFIEGKALGHKPTAVPAELPAANSERPAPIRG